MKKRLGALLGGDGLRARALRGVSMSMTNMMGQNVLRLVSNLILTRLLVPEAFGLMAIVGVFTTGMQMFTDLGIKASIIQSKRGDEPAFLNTAWTMQIIRGIILALGCVILAYPAALMYDEPMLLGLMAATGLNPLVSGFVTTKVGTERRKLHLSRVVSIQLLSQAISIVLMAVLAYYYRSVWVLVIGTVFGSALRVLLYRIYMPGMNNRLAWEPAAAREIFGFGKFIFLSTLCSFMITQGDKLILGIYVSTGLLGIYNIAYVMGILPVILIRGVMRGVVFPLYRLRPPAESPANQRNLFKARRLLVAGALAGTFVLACIAVPLVDLMYDDRYMLAGPIIMMICLASVPLIVFEGYGNALMAHGDTKRMFYVSVVTAAVQTVMLFVAISNFGILGAIIVPGAAALLTYPLLRRYVERYKALDSKGDMMFLASGFAAIGVVCWLNRAQILQLVS